MILSQIDDPSNPSTARLGLPQTVYEMYKLSVPPFGSKPARRACTMCSKEFLEFPTIQHSRFDSFVFIQVQVVVECECAE